MSKFTVLAFLVLPLPVWADSPERAPIVVDGATLALGSERIRLINIDAPDSIEPLCKQELLAGLRAKERLRQLVRSGSLMIERQGED